jgi:hypothetical protein
MAVGKPGVIASLAYSVKVLGEHAALLGLLGAGFAAVASGGWYASGLRKEIALLQARNEKDMAVLQADVAVNKERSEKDVAVMKERYEHKIAMVQSSVSHVDVCSQCPSGVVLCLCCLDHILLWSVAWSVYTRYGALMSMVRWVSVPPCS